MAYKIVIKFEYKEKIEFVSQELQNIGAVASMDATNLEIFSTNENPEPELELDVMTVFCEDKILDYCMKMFDDNITILSKTYIDDLYTPAFEKIEITKDFAIIPHEIQNTNYEHTLKLSPGLAFGSGHHETTNMCLHWIKHNNLNNKSVLDLGCGSGILALSAKLLWNCDVLAVDNDEQAIESSIENAKMNNLSITVSNDLPNKKQFDIIIANIYLNVLKDFVPFFKKALSKNGTLLLTGITKDQANDLKQYFFVGFNIIQHNIKDWVLIVVTKTNNANFVLNE